MRDAHLALRHGARRVVEDERRLPRQRDADAAGIGAEARIAAAVRRHARVRDDVDEVHRYQPVGYGHLGPVPDAPEVVRIAERHHARTVLLCALDRHLHGVAADHLAIAFAAIEREKRAGIERRLGMLVGREAAFEHRVDVARDHADAM